MDIVGEIGKVLISWGPGGVIALIAILLYREERKDRQTDRTNYEALLAKKDLKIEELQDGRLDDYKVLSEKTENALDKVAATASALQMVAKK